jgi:hypothetical protein
MSGFKPCNGDTYPITYTQLTFDPNPIVAGKPFNTTMAGTSKVTIQPGAIFNVELYTNGKLVIAKQHDYCDGRCPIGPGDFNETSTEVGKARPYDPVNTTVAFDARFSRKLNIIEIGSIRHKHFF